MDFAGVDPSVTRRIGQVEAVAGVGDEDHVPAEIRAHTHGRRDAHIGGNPEGDDMLCAEHLQALGEVRADEGGVDVLGDQRFANSRFEAGAKGVSRSAWGQS